MTIVVRPYDRRDAAPLRTLVRSVLEEHGFGAHLGGVDEDLAHIETRYVPPRAGFWVATDGDALVGSVAIRPKEHDVCELKRLYVDRARRGQGLGRRLYARAESFARDAGYAKIRLDSSRRFADAHRLYLRNGFRLVASFDNEWEDDVFEKALT